MNNNYIALATHYLEDNEHTVMGCEDNIIVAMDDTDEVLHFILITGREPGYTGLPEISLDNETRAVLEAAALKYLMANESKSCRVSMDTIVIQMTGEKMCLLKHHRNAFGSDKVEERYED